MAMLKDVRPGVLLTINEAAAELRVHPMTVRRMIGDGRLQALQLGGRRTPIRIPADALHAWLYSEGEA